MEEFDALLDVAKRLNGPGGCPWDHTQTFDSLTKYVIEEAHEVVEAVHGGDDTHLVEELGDLLYTVIFYAMIAEKEEKFSLAQIAGGVREKLIRRHPHVFGEKSSLSTEEVIKRWDEIKREEKPERVSVLDGIPKTLDLLVRARKTLSRMKKAGYPLSLEGEGVGPQVLSLIQEGHDCEGALRKELLKHERAFREWESHR